MKRYFLIIVLAFLTLGLTAQNADVLTLDSCFALAKANNAQFKTSQLQIEQAQQVKKQVFTKYFPQVSANYIGYYAVNPIIEYGVDQFSTDEFGQILFHGLNGALLRESAHIRAVHIGGNADELLHFGNHCRVVLRKVERAVEAGNGEFVLAQIAQRRH